MTAKIQSISGKKKKAASLAFLKEQLEEARDQAESTAYKFTVTVGRYAATPVTLDRAAQQMLLAAAELRMAARALVLFREPLPANLHAEAAR